MYLSIRVGWIYQDNGAIALLSVVLVIFVILSRWRVLVKL
jgi:hypothetical protein